MLTRSKLVFCHGTQANDAELRRTPPSRLDQILDHRHELVRLATLIDWHRFDQEFGRFYRPLGRPAKPTRLMVGLSYLQHTFNLSDEAVVQRWIENPYWERRETGKEQVVQVHYDEGVANHIGPEPCEAAVRRSSKRRQGHVQASH